MRFTVIALIALVAISYVNAAGILDNQTFLNCAKTISNLDCTKSTTTQAECEASNKALEDCQEEDANKTNCSALLTPDLSTYISCQSACVNKLTDTYAKDHYQKGLDCLNGSLLSSVAFILFGVVALLF